MATGGTDGGWQVFREREREGREDKMEGEAPAEPGAIRASGARLGGSLALPILRGFLRAFASFALAFAPLPRRRRRRRRLDLWRVLDVQLPLVAVGLQLRGVHGAGLGGQRAE